jgi:hypothetical protein
MAIVLLDTKDIDTTLLRNVSNTLPFNMMQRHGRRDSMVGRNPIFSRYFSNNDNNNNNNNNIIYLVASGLSPGDSGYYAYA